MTIATTQARLVAALAAARGLNLRGIEATLGAQPGALSKALSRGPLPRAEAAHARPAPTLTAEAVAGALGVDVGVLLGEAPIMLGAQADRPTRALNGRIPADEAEAIRSAGLTWLPWRRESGWTLATLSGGTDVMVWLPDPELGAGHPVNETPAHFGGFRLLTLGGVREWPDEPAKAAAVAASLADARVAEVWDAHCALAALQALPK